MARPNFLVFVTDQQRADHLGCYGNSVLKTPHIDALSRRGVTFERFFVASPVCMPNRAAMATGRMPSAAGVRMNGVPLPLAARTHAEVLRSAGWRTALVGKCHLQNMTETPPTRRRGDVAESAELQATADTRTEAAYQQESMACWRDPRHGVRVPYYGFEHVELCLEHGDQVGGDYRRWLQERGIDQASSTGPQRPGALRGVIAPQSWRTGLDEDHYPSAFVRDRTIDWLTAHSRDSADRPFYLQCSFPDPHHPFTPPGRWFDAYRPDDVSLPASFHAATKGGMPIKAALHAELAGGGRDASRSSRAVAVTPAEARQAIALAWGAIAMIDVMIGEVLATLGALGLERETIVVFTSDHGDFMGDHGLLFKGPLHYRSLIRMPFIWCDPHSPSGTRCRQLASAIDLAPTVLARAGLERHHGLQGVDLGRVIRDPNERTRESVLIEEEGHRELPGATGPSRVRTLVTDRWRLSVHAGEAWGELYDLEEDPDETDNRWSDPRCAGVRGELLWRLVDAIALHADDCPLPTRMA